MLVFGSNLFDWQCKQPWDFLCFPEVACSQTTAKSKEFARNCINKAKIGVSVDFSSFQPLLCWSVQTPEIMEWWEAFLLKTRDPGNKSPARAPGLFGVLGGACFENVRQFPAMLGWHFPEPGSLWIVAQLFLRLQSPDLGQLLNVLHPAMPSSDRLQQCFLCLLQMSKTTCPWQLW